MRSIEEQLAEVNRRAETIRRRRSVRRRRLAGATAACACLAVIVGAGLVMTRIPESTASMGNTPFGSLIATGGAPGYVMIGLLGFLLGVAVTILCVRLRTGNAAEWRDGQPHEGRSARRG